MIAPSTTNEFNQKQSILRNLIAAKKMDGLLLTRASSFSWATCGATSLINQACIEGEASLVITLTRRVIITNNIETPRLVDEEKLMQQGWEFTVVPWHSRNDAIAKFTAGFRFGSDAPSPLALDLSNDIRKIRSQLLPPEHDRYRELGKLCAQAIDATIRASKPGMTELEIAARLTSETVMRGVVPVIALVGSDRRNFLYRHPLPTPRKLEKFLVISLSGRSGGLICSMSRMAYFGKLSDDIRTRSEAAARIDARLIAATRPGKSTGMVFMEGVRAYNDAGYPQEWQNHDQGGLTGYEPAEILATPETSDPVLMGQAYSWNPSVLGARSEDTILVLENGNEIISPTPGWPVFSIAANERVIERPAVLEIT